MTKCRVCNIELNEKNQYPHNRRDNRRICISCSKEDCRKRYYKNKEKWLLRNKKYYKTHKEQIRKQHAEYYQKNEKKRKTYRSIYYKENCGKWTFQRHETRRKILERLGGKCVKCGFNDYRALQIDHIYGNGNKDREKMKKKGGHAWNKYLLSLSDEELKKDFQLLCANCNWIKRFEKREHGWSFNGKKENKKGTN